MKKQTLGWSLASLLFAAGVVFLWQQAADSGAIPTAFFLTLPLESVSHS
jgi:hypothetical protein